MKNIFRIFFSAALAGAMLLSFSFSTSGKSAFEVGKGCFMLDGKPFVVKAAELHYPRIPKPYWEHRIQMCRALGMNAVCLYVFWNFHEEKPGEFDFTGDRNLREFIELCAANDMKVILRPGPYVCAEWEMGGLPWWLLREDDIRLREKDPEFMKRVDIFMEKVAGQTKGLMDKDGGPIIMVQVENEYGSYGQNKPYVAAIRDIVRKHFGEETVLFQCDWSSNFLDNGLDDLLWTMNFGTGADIDSQFAELRRLRPDTPLMCSEFWSGWFDKWGIGHETRSADEMIAGIGEMLDKGISFSLYMTHGGTNRGHWAGANSPGYAPDVTSYDYDAPITEYGAIAPKYLRLRELLGKHSEESLPDIPPSTPVITVDAFRLDSVAPLWLNLPEAIHDSVFRPMEKYGQGFGSIIYSFTAPFSSERNVELVISEPHDFAQVFIDGNKVGVLDRRNGDTTLSLGRVDKDSRIDILVEGMGRINFGRGINDHKGITEDVHLKYDNLNLSPSSVDVTLLPDNLDFYKSFDFVATDALRDSPLPMGVYKGAFCIEKPGDTFLDMSSWGKGFVYVNGHDLGRFWEIGPQQTLYMPGCWLREGENEVVVLDVLGPGNNVLSGLDAPILDSLSASSGNSERKSLRDFRAPDGEPLISAGFPQINGWHEASAAASARGRYLWFVITSGHDLDATSVAEIQLTNPKGNMIPRENWKVVAVTGEDTESGNHTAEKAFDMQESTYWRCMTPKAPSAESSAVTPEPGLSSVSPESVSDDFGNALTEFIGLDAGAAAYALPSENIKSINDCNVLVIDLGKEYEVGGLRFLPRMESEAPEAPATIDIYIVE